MQARGTVLARRLAMRDKRHPANVLRVLTSFHGTSLSVATVLQAGGVDVTRGEGEFGRGFYTQKSSSEAMRWAQGRHRDGAIVEFRVSAAAYGTLSVKALDLKKARALTRRLASPVKRRTYLSGRDVMIGPLNGNDRNPQAKFESGAAQVVLNGAGTTRTVTR